METPGERTTEPRVERATPVERVWCAPTDPRELQAWFPGEADVEP